MREWEQEDRLAGRSARNVGTAGYEPPCSEGDPDDESHPFRQPTGMKA